MKSVRFYLTDVFISVILSFVVYTTYRGIVQLVERWSPKPNVEGSSPSAPAVASENIFRSHFCYTEKDRRGIRTDEENSKSADSRIYDNVHDRMRECGGSFRRE